MNVDSLLSSKDATIVSARFQSLNLRSSAIAQRALESRYDVPDKSGSEDPEEYEEFDSVRQRKSRGTVRHPCIDVQPPG
jgi:hypothetical protein